MIRNFSIELAGASFRFNTLSSTTLQVFQVYTRHEGVQKRFHMQRKNDSFYITDASVCPAEILALETDLSYAILNSQVSASM